MNKKKILVKGNVVNSEQADGQYLQRTVGIFDKEDEGEEMEVFQRVLIALNHVRFSIRNGAFL